MADAIPNVFTAGFCLGLAVGCMLAGLWIVVPPALVSAATCAWLARDITRHPLDGEDSSS